MSRFYGEYMSAIHGNCCDCGVPQLIPVVWDECCLGVFEFAVSDDELCEWFAEHAAESPDDHWSLDLAEERPWNN